MVSPAKTAKKQVAVKKLTKPQEVTAVLRDDHKVVSVLFAEYEAARSSANKRMIVAKICAEVCVDAQVQYEIFYPAVKAALKDKELTPEGMVENSTARDLIAQVEGKEPGGEMFDAKIMVLAEYVKHHVKKDHEEMLPKARATKLDMVALGAQLAARKAELLAERNTGNKRA